MRNGSAGKLWVVEARGFLKGYTESALESTFLTTGGFVFNLELSWNLFSQPKAVEYTPLFPAASVVLAEHRSDRQRALREDRKLPGC
jgi:hypothetical protein